MNENWRICAWTRKIGAFELMVMELHPPSDDDLAPDSRCGWTVEVPGGTTLSGNGPKPEICAKEAEEAVADLLAPEAEGS